MPVTSQGVVTAMSAAGRDERRMDDCPEPIPDFPGFIASLTAKGYTLNRCREHCPDKADEHAHLRTPDGDDMIVWADGRWSGYDLTQPARLIYPSGRLP